jgi:hypothetical protein
MQTPTWSAALSGQLGRKGKKKNGKHTSGGSSKTPSRMSKGQPINKRRAASDQMSFTELKEHIAGEEGKRNLSHEVFLSDGLPWKIKHKAQSDNERTKLHPARYHRLPLVHPKEYFKDFPKKRDVIIRILPMDHYGITGQVSESTICKLHNRSIVLTFDVFEKSTYQAGKTRNLSREIFRCKLSGLFIFEIFPRLGI